jgi:hypothetical protein
MAKVDQWMEMNAPPEPKPLPEVLPKRPPPVLDVLVAPKPVLVFEVPKPEGAKSLMPYLRVAERETVEQCA